MVYYTLTPRSGPNKTARAAVLYGSMFSKPCAPAQGRVQRTRAAAQAAALRVIIPYSCCERKKNGTGGGFVLYFWHIFSAKKGGTDMEPSVKPGRYRHFKGNEYEVLFCARHSETQEEMVVYRALYGERGLWVRPAAMWNETVERDGKASRRFAYIGPSDGRTPGE